MQNENAQPLHNIDLTSFTKANERMIAKNESSYNEINSYGIEYARRQREYTLSDVESIISHGSLAEQQKLSQAFYDEDGYYQQVILYYATLLKYSGLLVPIAAQGKSLSSPNLQKRYFNALDYIDCINIQTFAVNCAVKALLNGCYYGVLIKNEKDAFATIDLPTSYCRSRYKDTEGNDIIEFDVSYFDSINSVEARKSALEAYPAIITRQYKKYKEGNLESKWMIIPSTIGICFPFLEGRPPFLSVILKSLEYDEDTTLSRTRANEEIHKILVQKIPHLTDGRLLFEPDEAFEMHAGAVGMLKNESNVSVLTTYGDVDVVKSSLNSDNSDSVLTRKEQNIYAQAGVSGQVFSPTGSAGLETSLKNDLALMMYLANKIAQFITIKVNQLFGNSTISFKYQILPISYYNEQDYIDESFKLASSGYSLLLPSIAMGLNQREIGNLKDLENDVLKLRDKFIPLQSAFTSNSEESESGRPALKTEDKSDATVAKDISLEAN